MESKEMESKGWNNPSASAPSYDEAMNCSAVPPNQMQVYPNMPQPYSMPQHHYQPMTQPQMMPPVQAPAPPVVQQTVTVAGQFPTCRKCKKILQTRSEYTSTCGTHCAFLLCCLFICWPCAPFVYCTDMFRTKKFRCVNCGKSV
ncbi:uncharacterized protein LOC129577014 isoform X2 [Sitodiplosis mosellana]|nr:uncharacterized protein LOC129577014 isoform X2 [Sitodiplosis mosellana]XP_055319339.1 uncharacterized protein LOC129577014 isoform X2 [Sitodiplosis mosellana]XP_055319340.1 uncharacterized protein LOC129577014 isoform X2 [Sitodiplosis mosellana]XP_055319341.1 uncharacterized protein LOC129577014 isoform X2 [Sitodiplosis mosellana]